MNKLIFHPSHDVHYVPKEVYDMLKEQDRFKVKKKKGVEFLVDKKKRLWDITIQPKFEEDE